MPLRNRIKKLALLRFAGAILLIFIHSISVLAQPVPIPPSNVIPFPTPNNVVPITRAVKSTGGAVIAAKTGGTAVGGVTAAGVAAPIIIGGSGLLALSAGNAYREWRQAEQDLARAQAIANSMGEPGFVEGATDLDPNQAYWMYYNAGVIYQGQLLSQSTSRLSITGTTSIQLIVTPLEPTAAGDPRVSGRLLTDTRDETFLVTNLIELVRIVPQNSPNPETGPVVPPGSTPLPVGWGSLSPSQRGNAWDTLTDADIESVLNADPNASGQLQPGDDLSGSPVFDADGNEILDPGVVPDANPGSNPGSDPGSDPGQDGQDGQNGQNGQDADFPEVNLDFGSQAQERPNFIAYFWQEANAQNKFPLGFFSSEPITAPTLTCPRFTFFEREYELCVINDFLSVLKIPIQIAAVIWAIISL